MRNLIKLTLLFLFSQGAFAQNAPTATILPISTAYCTGVPITFSSVASRASASYSWGVVTTKGLASFTSLFSNTISLTFTTNLSYTISLYVSDTGGFSFSSLPIQVSKQPKSSFYASLDAAGFPVNLKLTNYCANNIASYWKYSDESTLDSTLSPTRLFNSPGYYTVSLIAKGLKGCSDTTHYAFDIPKSSSLVLPNIFTPNGDDVNDIYKPLTVGISQLKARVYNRYGAIIYSWDTVNGWWDGYTTSGMPCSDGQYFIVVEATGFDGQSYKLKSNVTIAR